jgi:hypothetical protein
MMNSRQIATLLLGCLIFVLTGLFPPVNRVRTMKVINESDGSEEVQEVQSEFHGYRFYFSMNHPLDGQEYRVAKIILAGEWLLLLVVMRTFFVAFRDNKPNLPQSRIFHQP